MKQNEPTAHSHDMRSKKKKRGQLEEAASQVEQKTQE